MDLEVPMYGFGAKPKFPGYTKTKAKHAFKLWDKTDLAGVSGLEGMLDTYKNALKHVELAGGPTLFKPIIKKAKKIAKKNEEDELYTVLLIITDGANEDMAETIDAIVDAQNLPLSIIIIAVGDYYDFSDKLKKLDGDKGKLVSSKGIVCQRDLVRFVPMKDFFGNPAALAKEALAEIPRQLVEFKMKAGKRPNPPIKR